ncbi:MAG TPA: NapC/NirT family cytochrome c [candidate division Zixibacteria bacterium]|nr:NapC/NirT family cytochrome c [candidate division Zixibacteria bacterium]
MRDLLRHPLSLSGAGVVLLSAASIAILFVIEVITGRSNPYIGVFIYMIYPALLLLGMVMIPVGAALQRRRRARGEGLPPYPVINLNDARTRGALFFIVVSGLFLMGFISTLAYQAYHFTDSVVFCGELCHSVMEPEYTAYQASPHARVTCAECHVGPGAGWYVRSKLAGAYQIYSVLFEKYPRPIPTPVHSLRPAQETCEQCHWPEKFFGAQLKVITRFAHDEKNSARQIRTLLRTGGGSPTTGITAGIHWHMNIANEVFYGAADRQRQRIPWVRIKDTQGRVTEYFDRTAPLTPEQAKKLEIRRMDCMDCHNRPSHIFRDPDGAVDLALLTGLIDGELPFIKREAVRALSAAYPSKEKAREGIATALDRFYLTSYPKLYPAKRESIKKAIAEVQKIYLTNIFPEMKVDWRTHPDNIGHTLFPGCFRCHDGKHVSPEGKVIRNECSLCHTIIGQEARAVASPEVEMAEKFEHPWPLAGKHAELRCNQCHFRGRGLEGDCASCHEARAELHQRPAHGAVPCETCHGARLAAAERSTCLGCHQDKSAHHDPLTCQTCHAFRATAKVAPAKPAGALPAPGKNG